MQLFKRTIDPLYVILTLGFILCMTLCLVVTIQVGSLQEQVEQITSTVNKLESFQYSTENNIDLPQFSPEQENDNLQLNAKSITITTDSVTIQTENEIILENNSPEPIIYYDQGLYIPSGLSAEQFNSVIENALTYYNREPEGYLAYNLGATFEEIERTYGINALYIIGITQRESGFNTSDNAKETNNLTSIMDGSSLKRYATVEENLLDTARLLKNVYYEKRGLRNIYDVGAVYNPVNDSWAPKVQESVNLFYSLINTPKS